MQMNMNGVKFGGGSKKAYHSPYSQRHVGGKQKV